MNVTIAAAVLNQTPLDWEQNLLHLQQVLRAARDEGVEVLCLPELCLCGYGCEDAFHAPSTFLWSWRLLQQLLPLCEGMVVNFGLPVWHQGAVYNSAALVIDGKLAGVVAKQHLAGDGIHYEPRWFKSWPSGLESEWLSPRGPVPFGDLIFELTGDHGEYLRLGFEICEDAWIASRPGGRLAERAVDLILNPSASHFAFGKHRIRERFVVEGSRAFAVAYLYANLNGNEAGRAIYDGGALLGSGGEIVGRGPRFSLQEWHLTKATVDVTKTRVTRARTASFRPNLTQHAEQAIRLPFSFAPDSPHESSICPPPAWEHGPYTKEEEFTQAVTLGLLDYLRKSASRGFVLSLSGGADSAACAVLIAHTLKRLHKELSPEQLAAKFAYWPGFDANMASFLTTLYQATANSGEVTRRAAATLAEALECRHAELDVGSLVDQYRHLTESALGRQLSWESDDIALQNIQARVRAPGPWMVANVLGALFLSTSNRSEAAVGYATMDGDTAGGLAPIAGIDKAFLRHWLRWMETVGPHGYEKLPALSAVNVQAPTAELRPSSAEQTDEDDLMPYPVLDRIQRLAIRDKMDPDGCYRRLAVDFPESTVQERLRWVDRFFRLFARNQWKRERYAPSFHLDDQNLDPKTWCRFPILSGSYAAELAELHRDHGP